MKFFIKKKKIFNILSKLNTYINISNKNIILTYVLVKIDFNALSLKVTDLDIEINCKIKLSKKNIFSIGSFTVNLRNLYELFRTYLNEDIIFLNLYKNRLRLCCLNSISLLNTLPVLQFPIINKNFSFCNKFSISSYILKKIIFSIHFSMGDQDIYYYLNGMLIEYKNGFFFFVTTDSYRISIYKLSIKYFKLLSKKKNFSLIISKKLVVELFKFFDFLDDKEVIFEVNFNMIRIIFNNYVIYGSLINGSFPDYSNIFLSFEDYFCVDLDLIIFKNALLRSLIISNNISNYVCLFFKNNCLILSSDDSNNNETKEKILIEYSGSNINLNLNIKFILDILNTIKNSSQIRIYFKDNNSIVKILNINDKYVNYMIMPIQL